MFFDIARILKAKRPKAFMLKNVKKLKGHDKGKTIKRSSSMADVVLGLKVLPTVSDPTAVDSDKDRYTDVDDPEPYNPLKYNTCKSKQWIFSIS